MSISTFRLLKATFRSFYNTWSLIGSAIVSTIRSIGRSISFLARQAANGISWLQSTIALLVFTGFSVSTILFSLFLPFLLYFDPLGIIWPSLAGSVSPKNLDIIRVVVSLFAAAFSGVFAVKLIADVKAGLLLSELSSDRPADGFSYAVSQLVSWLITLALIAYFAVFRLMFSLGWVDPGFSSALTYRIGAFWEAITSGRTLVGGSASMGDSEAVFLIFPPEKYTTADSLYSVLDQIDLRVGKCYYNLVDLSRKRIFPSPVESSCPDLPIMKIEYSNTYGSLKFRYLGGNEQWSAEYIEFIIR